VNGERVPAPEYQLPVVNHRPGDGIDKEMMSRGLVGQRLAEAVPLKGSRTMQRQGKILAVDDDPNNIAILEELLADDYDLETTTSGEQALEVAQTFRPDVILLDIMMPGMDGYQVCQRLREQDAFKYTKIIMVSARAMVPERLEGYKAGADDYITKPFDADEFLAKIQVYLRLKRAEEADQARHAVTVEAMDGLRALLAPVKSIMSDLRANAFGKTDAKLYHQLDDVNDGMDQIDEVINDFLDISEFYAGTVELQPTTFKIQSLISELADGFKSKMASWHIDLSTELPAQELLVNADRRAIATVLRNLIDSTITQPYEGQGVCIRVRNLQDKVGVDVEGNNPALNSSEIEQRLNGVHPARTSPGSARPRAGFGLAVAREFVELHGGRLYAESRPEGGVVYSFELPAAVVAQVALSSVGAESEDYR
jgi:two-component system, sensor histidine kinase and response regulator